MTNRVGFPVGFGVGFGIGQAAQEFASYPLSFAALGMTGADGIVFDSIESAILQSTGGAAAGNGDVIGDVQNVSGTAATITQGTGANKPTNTVTNGIGAITLGNSLYLGGSMSAALSSNSFSAIAVVYSPNIAGTFYPFVFDTDSLDYLVVENNTWQFRLDNASFPTVTDPYPVARIVRIRGTFADTRLATYNLAGVLQQSNTSTQPGDLIGTSFKIGYPNTQKAGEVAFLMLTDYDINDTLFNTIKERLVTRFGGWR